MTGPSPLGELLREFEQKAKAWQLDVLSMREKSAVNPPADTLEYAAKDLLALVHVVRAKAARLTPTQYARLHKTSEQTVRRWCAKGELPGARQTSRGEWEIPADAVRTSRLRAGAEERRRA